MTLPLPINSAGAAYTDINGLESLKKDSKSPQSVSKVAQQVEAMFLQMMLKSMRDANLGDGIFDSEEGKMYQDMFDKQVALDMSQHSKIGIGDMLMRQLTQKSDAASAPATLIPPAQTHSVVTDSAQFVTQALPAITQAAKKLGVSPKGMLAQAVLESGWGARIPKTADGRSSFNLFGIKAGANWTGARAIADTVEFNGTVAKRQTAVFRAYDSIQDCVNDYSKLLASSPRYAGALASGTNPAAFVRAMGTSGYATDPEYVNKLNQILASDRLQSAFAVRTASLQK
jgi:flagellar protein FlgJ